MKLLFWIYRATRKDSRGSEILDWNQSRQRKFGWEFGKSNFL